MTARQFLIVVALVQGVLLGALIVLIVLNRWFRLRRSTRLNPRREAVDASMRRWAAGTTPLAGVLVGLARLPGPLAIEAWSAGRPACPASAGANSRSALEQHWWAASSAPQQLRTWWKRLECARF